MKQSVNGKRIILILTMMSMMGLIASDIYLPGLNEISEGFNTSVHNTQLTIGVYLLGLALFQLVYGPLSDRYGRKPVLTTGVSIYFVASVLSMLTNSIEQLISLRFIQGCGACVGLVIGRAIISDLYDREGSAKVYNTIYPLVAASPAIAPLIGGYLINSYGWRSTFLAISFFSLILISLVKYYLPESNKNTCHNGKSLGSIYSDYIYIAKSKDFWKYTVAVLMLYGTWFTFLTQASFIYHNLGYSEKEIGGFYIPLAMMIYLGSRVCKLLIPRLGIDMTFFVGLMIFLFGSLYLFIWTHIYEVTMAYEIIAPMSILVISNGIVLTLGISSAIGINREKSGSASAVVGFSQIGFSSLCASLFGYFFDVSTRSMSSEIVVLSFIAVLSFIVLKKLTINKESL